MTYPPPQPAGTQRLRGRIPLILSVFFGVIGVGLAIAGVVLLLNSPIGEIDDFPRAAIDGQPHSVALDRTGNYVGYYEQPDLDTSKRSTPSFTLTITDSSGRSVRVARYSTVSNLSYDYGSHHGLAVAKFTIDRAGTYVVRAQGSDVPTSAEVALGESIATGLVGAVLLFVAGFVLVVVAVILLIVGLVKRSRHKREIASGYGGSGGYGGYPAGNQAGYQGGHQPPSYPPPAG